MQRLTIGELAVVLASAKSPPIERPAVSATEADPIVGLTAAAVSQIRNAQGRDGKPLLRISLESGGPGGFTYGLGFVDNSNPETDIRYTNNGVKIVVAQKNVRFLKGTVIDWLTTDEGETGFQFDNPNLDPLP